MHNHESSSKQNDYLTIILADDRDGVHLLPGVPPLRGLPHPRLPQRHLVPRHLLHRRGRPREQRLRRQQQGGFPHFV